MHKLLVFFFIVVFTFPVFSQPSEAVQFFPLKAGNIYVYKCNAYYIGIPCFKKYRIKTLNPLYLNSKWYFVSVTSEATITCIYGSCYPRFFSSDTLRIDSSNGNIYCYSAINGCAYTPFEYRLDSLNARLHDSIRSNCGLDGYPFVCDDTSSHNILGGSRKVKSFYRNPHEEYTSRIYARGLGLIQSTFGGMSDTKDFTLQGCVLDGVLYGDTSMIVGVNLISSEIPKHFELYQNYPNPFNPSTKVKFNIPLLRGVDAGGGRGVLVRLLIYNALGREVAVLVNESLAPGTYEAEFDASALASGIYYYSLKAGDFSQTNKMVLLK